MPLWELKGIVVAFGAIAYAMLEIRQADADAALAESVHVAFKAASEDAVRAFHAMALALGGRDNDAPGLRPAYEPGYFAAFVIDPDGHNLEAVFSPSAR